MDDINNLLELVNAVRDGLTGGYEVDFTIHPQREAHRDGDGFFTVIDVQSTEPDPVYSVNGQWWFDADGHVMQVL